jgi:dTDP-glucose 4,6-dehydratase
LGRKIPVHNDGTPIRTWLHAEDTARAVIALIESQVSNEIYNISGGFEQSNIETIKKILTSLLKTNDYNIEKYIDFSYSRLGQDLRYSLDDSKLRSLGWKPIKNFDNELPLVIEYYRKKFIW